MFSSRLLGVGSVTVPLALLACTEAPPRMVVDPDLAALEADYIIFGLTDNVTRPPSMPGTRIRWICWTRWCGTRDPKPTGSSST